MSHSSIVIVSSGEFLLTRMILVGEIVREVNIYMPIMGNLWPLKTNNRTDIFIDEHFKSHFLERFVYTPKIARSNIIFRCIWRQCSRDLRSWCSFWCIGSEGERIFLNQGFVSWYLETLVEALVCSTMHFRSQRRAIRWIWWDLEVFVSYICSLGGGGTGGGGRGGVGIQHVYKAGRFEGRLAAFQYPFIGKLSC